MEVLAAIIILLAKLSPKVLCMITRKSFFIRWLLSTESDRQSERSVIEIQHIQSGSKQSVSTLEEAAQWMRDAKESEKEDRIIESE